jgi:hypothetical protein
MPEEPTVVIDNKGPVLLRSPIEFAVVGPSGGRDKVLLRSAKAGLDLIGLAADGARSKDWPSPDILSLIFGEAKQLNIVFSFPVADTNPQKDKRRSALMFVWRGFASKFSIERVREKLNLQLPELDAAISSRNKSEIEWALAPIIYQCMQANERRLRVRRLLLASTGIYISIGILAAIFAVVTSLAVWVQHAIR